MNVKIILVALVVVSNAGCSESAIDACLDNGGSFNYEQCECDFDKSHEYKESHSC